MMVMTMVISKTEREKGREGRKESESNPIQSITYRITIVFVFVFVLLPLSLSDSIVSLCFPLIRYLKNTDRT